ncbi:MAG TPA: aspartyl protease family protein [Planctomycetota bacterium]|nr:aspartyl protease family protein [Planctomycetota bacterium]
MRILTTLIFGLLPLALAGAEESVRLSRELSEYLKRPEAQVRIADGALLICKQAHPELDLAAERKALAALGAELKTALAGAAKIPQQAEALAKYLYEQQNFGLPEKDDAAAFLLTDVIRNKRGNCLGLSVLCLALAEESGVPLKLYGVPISSRTSESGHTIVRFDDAATRRNFDPVEKGAEHPNDYYVKEFKLSADDLRSGYVLGNASKRDVLALLLVNLGGAYIDDGKAAKAVPVLEAALSLRANSAAAHSNLAGAKLSLGDTAAAEKEYAAALRIDAKFFPARIGMADIALSKGETSATRLVEELVAQEPENVQARTLQAALLIQRNDLKGAIKVLNDLSAAPTADVTVWNNLGKCYAQNGDAALAEDSYRRALVYDDKNADAHCGLGRALLAEGKKTDAAAELDAAIKLDPTNATAKAARAEIGSIAKAPENPNDAKPAEQKALEYPKGTTVVPFRIEANRIFVTVRLNDAVDADAILDTGTEITLLNSARVKLNGLRASHSEELIGDMVGRVAVDMVTLDSIKIGDTVVRTQPVGRAEQGAGTKFERIDFVLGMDVLSKMRFTIDFNQSKLILWPANSKLPAPAATISRVQVALIRPPSASPIRAYISATLNGKNAATFLVDTGADAPMFVAFKKPSELGFAAAAQAGTLRIVDGAAKQELPYYQTAFATMEIGKAVFKEVGGRVIDASGVNSPVARGNLAFLNVIGTPFLKTLQAVTIDVPGHTAAFDRVKIDP